MKKLITSILIILTTSLSAQFALGGEAGVKINRKAEISEPIMQMAIGVQGQIGPVNLSYNTSGIASAGLIFKSFSDLPCDQSKSGFLIGANIATDFKGSYMPGIILGHDYGYEHDAVITFKWNPLTGVQMGGMWTF